MPPTVGKRFGLVLLIAVSAAGLAGPTQPAVAQGPPPLEFLANEGQMPSEVAFHAEGASHTVALGTTRASMAPRGGVAVDVLFDNASTSTEVTGTDELGTSGLFLFADDTDHPIVGIPVYQSVSYVGLYPGIDATFSGVHGRLERQLEIAAGADPAAITLRYGGAADVAKTSGEKLEITTPSGTITEARPLAYQVSAGGNEPVDAQFEVNPDDTVGLVCNGSDPGKALYVKLALDYSALLTGDPGAEDRGIHDAEGNINLTRATKLTDILDSQSGRQQDEIEAAREPAMGPAALIPGSDYGGADLVPADGDVLSGAFTNVGLFHVASGTTMFVDPGVPLSVTAEEILIEGTIDADGAGYAGGETNPVEGTSGLPGEGPGGGNGGDFGGCVHGNGGGGGGYGGAGGDSSHLFTSGPPATLGGPAYGSPNPPGIMMGSGGGSAANYCSEVLGGPGGNGGGAVELHATVLTVTGTIRADGADGELIGSPTRSGGGGGSGGGIWLDGCLTLTGATLSATGGAGAGDPSGSGFAQGGGGGGGGRIKLSGAVAPGTVYSALVAGGPPGEGSILDGQVGGEQGTPGADGTVVDETVDNGGPCVLEVPTPTPAAAVGGFGMGRVVAGTESGAVTKQQPGPTQLLSLAATLVVFAGAAILVGRRRRRSR